LEYRVYRAADGLFLGKILVTIPENGVVQFNADAQLQASVPPDGTMLRWRLEEFTVVNTTGSGYAVTTTTFNFSPDQLYQAVASGGTINIQSRKTGKIVGTFSGGGLHGTLPMTFTPDSTRLAIWDGDSNATKLLSLPDGELVMAFPDAVENEGIGSIRFSPDGTRLVTTGYLPFQTPNGWSQKGLIRFWSVREGRMRHQFDQHTGISVTSPIAWSPDASQFVYGTYEGGIVAAFTPAP
jgi:WD40 repeat protein